MIVLYRIEVLVLHDYIRMSLDESKVVIFIARITKRSPKNGQPLA